MRGLLSGAWEINCREFSKDTPRSRIICVGRANLVDEIAEANLLIVYENPSAPFAATKANSFEETALSVRFGFIVGVLARGGDSEIGPPIIQSVVVLVINHRIAPDAEDMARQPYPMSAPIFPPNKASSRATQLTLFDLDPAGKAQKIGSINQNNTMLATNVHDGVASRTRSKEGGGRNLPQLRPVDRGRGEGHAAALDGCHGSTVSSMAICSSESPTSIGWRQPVVLRMWMASGRDGFRLPLKTSLA